MDEIGDALAGQQAELSRVLAPLRGVDWDRPSRCPGWSVTDVLIHLSQTDAMALASLQGRFEAQLEELTAGLPPTGSVDDGAGLMVERERQRGLPGPEIRDRWEAGAETLLIALRRSRPRRRVSWVAGELSVRTLCTTRLAETWIHTGDVTWAFGALPAPTERLEPICRLAWRTLPYAFAQAGRSLSGPVAFELEGVGGVPWTFVPDEPAATVVRGDALDLCLVAARRVDPAHTRLEADGPDGPAVLELVRTFA